MEKLHAIIILVILIIIFIAKLYMDLHYSFLIDLPLSKAYNCNLTNKIIEFYTYRNHIYRNYPKIKDLYTDYFKLVAFNINIAAMIFFMFIAGIALKMDPFAFLLLVILVIAISGDSIIAVILVYASQGYYLIDLDANNIYDNNWVTQSTHLQFYMTLADTLNKQLTILFTTFNLYKYDQKYDDLVDHACNIFNTKHGSNVAAIKNLVLDDNYKNNFLNILKQNNELNSLKIQDKQYAYYDYMNHLCNTVIEKKDKESITKELKSIVIYNKTSFLENRKVISSYLDKILDYKNVILKNIKKIHNLDSELEALRMFKDDTDKYINYFEISETLNSITVQDIMHILYYNLNSNADNVALVQLKIEELYQTAAIDMRKDNNSNTRIMNDIYVLCKGYNKNILLDIFTNYLLKIILLFFIINILLNVFEQQYIIYMTVIVLLTISLLYISFNQLINENSI